jgi:hypothetical protein
MRIRISLAALKHKKVEKYEELSETKELSGFFLSLIKFKMFYGYKSISSV